MKKLLLLPLFFLLTMMVPTVEAAQTYENASFKNRASLPILGLGLYEWAKYNDQDQVVGSHGISWGLGYYSKNFFEPAKLNTWNGFWHWGTILVLIPFAGVGVEYTAEKYYFDVSTIYFIPRVTVGFNI
ncbi:hypothetical protein DID77_03980 [Candidatus Marinamargulisbacteria bacterium SCGC AG-439-L15]|nr:hypothetical protein DID77_03980 [Candidatus Marinamargulisbacteria bacterium SCGC AG-439-L15]